MRKYRSEEKRENINHKLEYEIKQQIYNYWSHRDITGKAKAILNY